jgi:prepilin-type N-terminal cleavage/methylation domain-containing protein
MKKTNGFTLAEMLVSSTILLVIIITIYFLVTSTQSTHLSEGRKLDMNQAARAFEQLLCDNIRSAGSILSLLHTPSFLEAPAPFTGIYPLNNNDFPDGIILASGDPQGVTETTAAFDASTLPASIALTTVVDPEDASKTAWQKDDIGLVIRAEGYYIFKVTVTPSLIDTTLVIRTTPVYYSGLLNTTHYDDLTDDHNSDANKKGNAYSYPSGSPVIRLEYFTIFLIEESAGVRSLTLTSDTEGVGDIFNNPATPTRGVPIFSNIEDLQFEYVTRDTPPEFWASISTSGTSYPDPCSSTSGTACTDFINQFTNRNIAAVRVYVLFKTEEEINKPRGSGITFEKPVMGDIAASTLPVGRFHYNYMRYEISTRNYHIVY